jgi:hypothetical protein
MGIFADCTSTSGTAFNNFAKAKIYRVKFWTDGELVHDYLPCVQGGVAGFKDLVDGAFVTSGGLTSGGDITSEEGDAYIESTNGNCYIDTGYYFGPKTRIDADFASRHRRAAVRLRSRDRSGGAGFYINGSAQYAGHATTTLALEPSTGVPLAAYVRRFGTIDANNMAVAFSTAVYQLHRHDLSCTKTCTKALVMFASVAKNRTMPRCGFTVQDLRRRRARARPTLPYVINGAAGVKEYLAIVCGERQWQRFFLGRGCSGRVGRPPTLKRTARRPSTRLLPNPDTKIVADFQMMTFVGQMRPFGEVNA